MENNSENIVAALDAALDAESKAKASRTRRRVTTAAADEPAPVVKKRRGRPPKNAVAVENTAADAAENAAANTLDASSADSGVAAADAQPQVKPRVSRARKSVAAAEPVEAAGNSQESVSGEVAEPVVKRRGRPRKTAVVAETVSAETADTAAVAAADTPAAVVSDAAASGVEESAAQQPQKRRGRPAKKTQVEAPTDIAAELDAAVFGDEKAEKPVVAADASAQVDGSDSGKDERAESGKDERIEIRTRQRTRQRDRKRRGDDFEELTEDDVLLPIAGVLDVLDNYAFVRTSGYLPGVSDVYVSLSQVKRYGLRKGDAVVGAIKQPREGENGGRQKYNPLVKIDAINGAPAEDALKRPQFAETTPLMPEVPVCIGDALGTTLARQIDIFAPLAFGQRGAVLAGCGTGLTTTLVTIAQGYAATNPDTHIMYVAVGGRPEETTLLQRQVSGEVIAAAADRPVEDRTTVVELALERAKRLAEIGHDVVLLIDSMDDFMHAVELQTFNPKATYMGIANPFTKQAALDIFAAARNIENGGSLAIYAGFELFNVWESSDAPAIANWSLTLDAQAATAGVFPAFSLSGTRVVGAQALQQPATFAAAQQARMRNLHSIGELERLAEFNSLIASAADTASALTALLNN